VKRQQNEKGVGGVNASRDFQFFTGSIFYSTKGKKQFLRRWQYHVISTKTEGQSFWHYNYYLN
jgi:hypothetical protein